MLHVFPTIRVTVTLDSLDQNVQVRVGLLYVYLRMFKYNKEIYVDAWLLVGGMLLAIVFIDWHLLQVLV